MSGYRSKIDIGLGQMPEVKDNPAMFNELQGVYNAIHILNAVANQLVGRGGECTPGPETKPWESFNFECKSFWAPVSNDVEAGNLVSLRDGRWRPGVRVASRSQGPKTQKNVTFTSARRHVHYEATITTTTDLFGVVLELPEDSEFSGTAHIGLPPAIIELDNVEVGDIVFGRANDGQLYYGEHQTGYYAVGVCVAPGAVLLQTGKPFSFTGSAGTETFREGGGN